jgi:hypothetical protein
MSCFRLFYILVKFFFLTIKAAFEVMIFCIWTFISTFIYISPVLLLSFWPLVLAGLFLFLHCYITAGVFFVIGILWMKLIGVNQAYARAWRELDPKHKQAIINVFNVKAWFK